MTDILYIDDDAGLTELLEDRLTVSPVAADTEFLREKTYHPKLCLLQLAVGNWAACVDPLSAIDTTPLWRRLAGLDLTFHAARQDLEVMLATRGILPAKIFDTQIAAALIGYPAQVGYANLVREVLDIELPKHHTRTDWSRRPLRQAEIDYAVDDVRYLGELRTELVRRLDRFGRREWALADSEALLDPSLYDPSPDTAWQRLKSLHRLDERTAAIAASLAVWREREALRLDRPRQWILRDAALLAIAQAAPRDRDALAGIDGVPAGLVRRAGRDVVRAVVDAGPTPVTRRAAPTDAEKALISRIGKLVRDRAEALGIEPEVIASQKEIRQAVSEDAPFRALQGWRGEVLEPDIRRLLGDQPPRTAVNRS